MKNMNGVNGGDQILRLKIVEGKAEVTAGNKLSDVTNDKIREYFQNNVDTGAKDGVISEAEIKAHRDSQAQQSSDPTQWKTTFGKDENGNTYEIRTRGAVTQYYDGLKRLVKVVTDKGNGLADEIRYEYDGNGFDVINKMVVVNGSEHLSATRLSQTDAPVAKSALGEGAPASAENTPVDRTEEALPNENPAGNEQVSEERGGADPAQAANNGGSAAPTEEAGAADGTQAAAQAEEADGANAADEAGAAAAAEGADETEEAEEAADAEEAAAAEDAEEDAAQAEESENTPEIKRNAKGEMISYAKNGESFKQTAERLGFKPGTPEYEAFAEANKTAAKQGWFIVGKEVIIPKSIEDKVNKEGLNVDSKGEIEKYNKAITDGADVSKYEGKTETKTLDKNSTWWALAKESLAAEGNETPTMKEIQTRTGELMALNEGKNPVKGTEITLPKAENTENAEEAEETGAADETEEAEGASAADGAGAANEAEAPDSGARQAEGAETMTPEQRQAKINEEANAIVNSMDGVPEETKQMFVESNKTLAEAAYADPPLEVVKEEDGSETVTLPDGRKVSVVRTEQGEILSVYIDKDPANEADGYDIMYTGDNAFFTPDKNSEPFSESIPGDKYNFNKILELVNKIFGK